MRVAENKEVFTDPVLVIFKEATEPLKDAIVYSCLFGSRARDNFRPDSDYDILIVLKEKNRSVIDRLYDIVMDILLETGRLVSLKIFSSEEFDRLRAIPTPFMKNVLEEGKRLG